MDRFFTQAQTGHAIPLKADTHVRFIKPGKAHCCCTLARSSQGSYTCKNMCLATG